MCAQPTQPQTWLPEMPLLWKVIKWSRLRYPCKCYYLLKIKEKLGNQGGSWTQEWVALTNVASASPAHHSTSAHVATLSASPAGVAGWHLPKAPLPPVQPTFARLGLPVLTWPGWLEASWWPPCRVSGWQTCLPLIPSSPLAQNQAVIGWLCLTILMLRASGVLVAKATAPLASQSHTSLPLAPR